MDSYGYKKIIRSKESYLFAEGNIEITFVAHLDTVLPIPQDIKFDEIAEYFYSLTGLGADDRAGVYCILRLLEEFQKYEIRPNVIFTMDEEIGGVGAKALVDKHPDPPFDSAFIIEFDRQGINDCVFYQCANESFVDFIEKYGFELEYGSFTDISIIAPAWKAAAVNLSVGYFNEHFYKEKFLPKIAERTIDRVKTMIIDWIKSENGQVFFPYIKEETEGRCALCGQYISKNLMIKVYVGGVKQSLCSGCFSYLMEKDNDIFDD